MLGEGLPPGSDRNSCKTPVLVTGVCLTLLTLAVLGGMVGELLVRLEVLEVRVETRNERELEKVKKEVAVLDERLENLKETESDFQDELKMLSSRIDGLQEAFKTGDVKYLVSEAQHVRACHLSTFPLLVMSVSFSVTLLF